MRGGRKWAEHAAAVGAGLTSLEAQKEALLAALRTACEQGSESETFDADRAWCRLRTLAGLLLWGWVGRRTTTHAADRRKRLRKIEKALGKARTLVRSAMQADVGDDLFYAWASTIDVSILSADQLVAFHNGDGTLQRAANLETRFAEVVEALPALEAAAARAAKIRGQGGKPAGLPEGDIRSLAAIYQDATRREPGTGHTPFTRFVMTFRAALDPSYNVGTAAERWDESMVDAIKLALGKRRKRPPRTKVPKRRRLIPYAGQLK